ncbi:hypothetical protein BDY24DRAFT_388391 [Mrakia frigida]|uniref:uncharacterized protein n=1 Tax=Mrakia frigida TaxID=29902 RepID=UPI003FCC093D
MESPPRRSSINFSRPLRGQLQPPRPPPPPQQFAFPIASSSRSRRNRQEVLDPSYAVRSRPHVVASPSVVPPPPSPNTTCSSSSISRDLRRLHRRQTSLLSKPSPLTEAELISLSVTQQHILETQAQLRNGPIPALPFPLGEVWNGEDADEFGMSSSSRGGGVKLGESRLGSIAVDSLTTTRRSTTGRTKFVRGSPVRAIHHGKEGGKPYGRKDRKPSTSTSTSPTRPRSRTPLASKLSNFLQPKPSSSKNKNKNKNKKRPSSPSSQSSPPPKRAKRQFSFASLRTHPHKNDASTSCPAGVVPAGWRRKRTRSNWGLGEDGGFELVTGEGGAVGEHGKGGWRG